MPRLNALLVLLHLIVSECLVCRWYYNVKLAGGTAGGISHGICGQRCKAAMRVQMGLRA